ncbi:MAG TPA: hypothetical protein EYG69_02360 [Campylobacterales bacterium]|nr:hypothetical protein [Campylobacterales bacterium]
MRLLFLLIFSITLSFAYTDSDIDGVSDLYDRCPDTSFDEIADELGCSDKQKYYGELTLSIGSDISWDKLLDKTTSSDFALDYRYNSFAFSLSNSNYQDVASDDIYISGGYRLLKENFQTKFIIGVKLSPVANDYFSIISYNYFIDKNTDLLLHYGYTLIADSKEIYYENFHSFSAGFGYAFNSNYYSSLSYDYSGSVYKDSDNYRAISWFNSYEFSKRYFMTINYSKALDDSSYDNTLSLKFGLNFE